RRASQLICDCQNCQDCQKSLCFNLQFLAITNSGNLYPCLCLCFAFSQITRTTPLRCTILHLSQIFLTDARTFMVFPYLYRYTIRPRVRSYGESSTATLSPGRMRIKFLRILPETCAST